MAHPYTAPLADMRFVIEEVLQAPASWARCGRFAEVDAGMAAQVLEEAGRFAAEVLAPTNAPGDLEGCRLDQGQVRTPGGFREAYRTFVDGGWPALACDAQWGGQGLPLLLEAALYEMLLSCNQAWSMYPGLLHGAYATLEAHGSEALKALYLPKLASGEWLAAMALTEPQAGSDLGQVRTRAEAQADGSLRVTGSKIFISGADHDLTDNIVHLVLCRLPDAPPGSKGLSLALVPKLLPDGSRNGIEVDALEHKMGIHGSATCALRYEGATGWLIGAPHRGLQAMFVMMNAARLHVGLQGLGHLERATQSALAYAAERRQLRAPAVPEGQDHRGADPIAWHPAMRRTLWTLRALTEGLRVVAYRAALLIDEAQHHADPERRARSQRLAALLTPIVKAFGTHQGFQGVSAALQVFGGYGYVHEYGIEQQLRDLRIALIYEGTNEIQAIDLLQRKVLADGGAALHALVDDIEAEAARCEAALPHMAEALRRECARLLEATAALQAGREQDPEWPLRVADDYLMGCGHLLLAWAWAAMARAAAGGDDAARARHQRELADFGLQWLLPQAERHWRQVLAREAGLPWV
ncbi:acyl-CoA dehydrogenase family protein [Azohydromonas caseinilytica]|uniref:Acyl-CoA dehydrogenase n=1 Tax=Azohydromonas caseinilytica TaxID=2728836 RepID=A0A848FKP7_9BURK|nr:acyl-CoA dehydrogenase family protein [Azohydromonas caseinilytica]NML18840.1 acyl-CoA dehydrogenase [Azohydromonas caseinilytica]